MKPECEEQPMLRLAAQMLKAAEVFDRAESLLEANGWKWCRDCKRWVSPQDTCPHVEENL